LREVRGIGRFAACAGRPATGTSKRTPSGKPGTAEASRRPPAISSTTEIVSPPSAASPRATVARAEPSARVNSLAPVRAVKNCPSAA
jgi:hypothetical protein